MTRTTITIANFVMAIQYHRRTFGAATAVAFASSLCRPVQAVTDGNQEQERPGVPVESAFVRDYPPPAFKPPWKKPQINRQLAADFVIYAHSDLKMVKKLLDREPGLLNATIDWGAGDWEDGLGGATHMGRRDIVEYLLSRGARLNIFTAAMLGLLASVKEMLAVQPALIDATGPHGFTLHFHAQVGQEKAQPVLEYLQSIRKKELKPVPFLNNRSPGK